MFVDLLLSTMALPLLILTFLLLHSMAVDARWDCDCEEHLVGCNVYGTGTSMFVSMGITTTNGNLLISPFGLWVVLISAYGASDGHTKNSLYKALFPSAPRECDAETAIFKYYKFSTGVYQSKFKEETAPFYVSLSTIYSKTSSANVTPSYMTIMQSIPDADSKGVYFNKYGSLQTVRDYKANTYRFKGNFLQAEDLTPTTEFVIQSLLKFHVKWKIPFSRVYEYPHQGKRYSMMHASGLFTSDYDKSRDTSYLYLEFQNHTGLSMLILLSDRDHRPEPNWDMFDLRDKPAKYQNVSIPKFKFEVQYSLKQVVNYLNCDILFREGCRLSQVHGVNSKVSQVVQKTVVSIDEGGVMFEAYTALIADPKGVPRDQPYQHRPYQNPFMFYLFAYETVIAHGQVMDPTYN